MWTSCPSNPRHRLSRLQQRSNRYFLAQQSFWIPQVNTIKGHGQRKLVSKLCCLCWFLLPDSKVAKLFDCKFRHSKFQASPFCCRHKPEFFHPVGTVIGCRQRRFVRKWSGSKWVRSLIRRLQQAGRIDCSRNQKLFYHRFELVCDFNRMKRHWCGTLPCWRAK